MTKNLQQENNNSKPLAFQLVLPLDVEVKIDADASVRRLLEITERMDYSQLNAAYKRLPNVKEASPKQMFQLVIMGFMEGIYSSRKLEKACKHDIRFMYLLGGARAPDHNRFATFIKERLQGGAAEHLFYQLVEYLEGAGEIDFTNLFVDGTKIEANANRYSFVWKKSTNKYEARLDEKLSAVLKRLACDYAFDIPPGAAAEESLAILKELAKRVTFVYRRGRRKTPLQRDIEELEGYLARKAKYAAYNKSFKGRNSFSKTDRDATFMRMKDDHMRNGQLTPGYNLTLGVEGEYIVGLDISSERSDQMTLLPLLDRLEAGCGKRHKNVSADAGYESEENYKGLKKRSQTAYIKPQSYEKSKTRKYKTNAYLRENMPYDPDEDTYMCPEGNYFSYSDTTTRKNKNGFESEITVYECHGCSECPQKKSCTRAKDNRKIYVSKDFIDLRDESKDRITSHKGQVLRLNRSIQAEGAFGVLKQDYGFRRFLRRGAENVFTETILYAFAYNVNKFHNKKKRKLLGVSLHLLSSA
jgi:transposase